MDTFVLVLSSPYSAFEKKLLVLKGSPFSSLNLFSIEPQPLHPDELYFAKHYSASDYPLIEVNLEKIEGERIDVNYELRMRLCEYYREDISLCATPLLLDLYRSLAESSKTTFSIYAYFHLFANEILERYGSTYFDIYHEGARQSFDAMLASARLNLSSTRVQELVSFLDDRLESSEEPEMKKQYAFMLKRFQGLSSFTP